MEDYYRVRFRKLIGRPGPHLDLEMPKPLRLVYGASSLLAALGWLAVVGLGRSSPVAGELPWLLLLSLSFPIWVVLYLGFSEQQGWTRPLIVALLVAAALLFRLSGASVPSLAVGALAVVAAGYLYGSSAVRSYYGACRQNALVRITAADLRRAVFIPLYTAAAGGILGALFGYFLVTRHLGYSSGLGANDVMAIVCTAVLLAVLVGLLGHWLGEAIVSRMCRAA